LKIIGTYAPAGEYKFLYYYSWLGSSISEIIINIFVQPLVVLRHLFTFRNIEMLIGLLLPFIFLPLWSKKYLILLLGPLFQIMMGAPGGSSLILKTHYNLLMLPALVISMIYALKIFLNKPIGQKSRFEIIRILSKEKGLLLSVFIVGTIFSSLALGPLVGSAYMGLKNTVEYDRVKIKQYFLEKIPKNASVATTYEFLNNLSSRRKVYSMHYAFIGKKQYSEVDYELPKETDYLLIDFYDFFLYQIQFSQNPIYKKSFNQADDNMRRLLKDYELVEIFDDYALFKRSNVRRVLPLYQIADKKPEHKYSVELEDKIRFLGWEINNKNFESGLADYSQQLFPLSLFWQAQKSLASTSPDIPAQNYQLKMIITDSNYELLYEKFYPLGYNIYPTSEWPVGETVQTNYWFYIPSEFAQDENILQFELVQVDGSMMLNSLRQAELKYNEISLRPSLVIGKMGDLKD